MPLIQTTPPAIEPVSIEDVQLHSRIIDSEEETLLLLMIGAARRYAEMYTGRSFITQSWRLVMDDWPGPSLMGVPYGVPYSMPGHAVQLERGPVLTVDSIKYLQAGATITLDPATYVSDLSGPVPRITPVFGQIWPPISTPQIGNVQVNYTAGYGPAASDVPEGIRHWILVRVATMYENREAVAILPRGKVEPLPYIDTLLDPYAVVLA